MKQKLMNCRFERAYGKRVFMVVGFNGIFGKGADPL